MKFRSLAVAAALMLASFAAWSQTLCIAPLVVNNVADSGCGSLRNAIQFANSPAILTAGPTGACPIVTASGPTITFDTSAGPLVIKPATPLPALTCTYGVNIDGGGTANTATQGSTNAVIKVEIDGSACVDPSFARGPVQQKTVGACDGLHVQSSATIRGLAVHSFAGSAIVVDSGGLDLYGNFLGTDATGIAAGKGNGQAGVLVNAGSLFAGGASGPGDRNLISGNAGPGVHVMDGGSSLHLVDNLIGGDRNGGAGLTNDSAGVFIEGTAGISALISNNDIRHNLGYGISTSRNNVEVRQNIIALNGGDSLVNVAPVDPPLIQSFTYDGTNTTVIVTTQNFGFGGVVDLFSNPSFTPTTPPTEREGQVYLTPLSTSSTTDTIARTWTIVVPGELSFPTATFTGSCDCSTSPTSEYSDPAFPPLAEVVPTAGTVGVGVQTSVTVVLFNANSLQTLSNIVATYSVPSPLQLGSGGVTYTGECGSAISPTANGFQVANLTLSPGGQCTIQVPVFSSTPGLHPTGSVDNITSSLGVGGTIGSTPLLVVAPALQLDASTLFFPNQDVGTTSAPQSVFINNIGTSDLSVTSVVSSAPSEFIVTGCTSALVAPAAPACIFNVAFSPAAGGARSATITISSNDASSPHIVSVGGNGIVPAPALTPANFSFGNVPVGGSANSTFAIANPTSVAIPITISLSATGFSSATTCPATLAAGASCTVTVTFAPASVTPYSATLQVQSSATTPSVVSAVISGNGTATLLPVLSASPGALSFGVQAVATTSPAQNVVVKNTGNAALNIGAVTFAGGDFSGSGCAGLSIAPGSFCTISVTFTPTASGTRAGTLTIASNDAASPATVALSGTGGTAGVVFAPASLTFPRQGVGTTSAPQSVVLTNNGNSDLQIPSISATGDFGYTGCGFPLTLVSGASCTFSVTFSPLSNGVLTGAITVADNAPGSPHQLALSGTGANGPQPSLAVRPSSLDFGDARIGSQHTDTVTITSNGSAPLAIASISTSAGDFVETNSCPATLAVGASCDVTVIFTPSAAGARTGHLIIASNGDPALFNVALTGNGVPIPPGVIAVDRFVDFGQHVIATTSRTSLILRNSGEQPVNVTIMEVRGTGFALEGSCATIAPADGCTVTLVFTPPSIGTFAGTLTILSNDARGPIRVDLLGQGVALPRPEIELSVDGIGFANQFITTRSPAQRITVRSVGTAPLHIGGISVTGPFELSGSCPAAMAAGTTCDLSVSFLPVTAGQSEGRLTVESDAQAGRGFASLTGTGCRFFSVAGMRSLQRLCQ